MASSLRSILRHQRDAFRPKQLLRQPPAASKASPYGSPDATKRSTTRRTDGPPRRGRQSLGSAGGLQEKLDITDGRWSSPRTPQDIPSPIASCAREGINALRRVGGDGRSAAAGLVTDQGRSRQPRVMRQRAFSCKVVTSARGACLLRRSDTPTRPASSHDLHVLLRHRLPDARPLRGHGPIPELLHVDVPSPCVRRQVPVASMSAYRGRGRRRARPGVTTTVGGFDRSPTPSVTAVVSLAQLLEPAHDGRPTLRTAPAGLPFRSAAGDARRTNYAKASFHVPEFTCSDSASHDAALSPRDRLLHSPAALRVSAGCPVAARDGSASGKLMTIPYWVSIGIPPGERPRRWPRPNTVPPRSRISSKRTTVQERRWSPTSTASFPHDREIACLPAG